VRLWSDKDAMSVSKFPLLHEKIALASSPVQKADLLRLEAIFQEGGFYVDLDFEPCRPIDVFTRLSGGVVCHEDGDEGMWQSLSNGFFGFSRGHPGLQKVISLARRSQTNNGPPNWSTGPRLLRKALQQEAIRGISVLPRNIMYPVRFLHAERLRDLQCAFHGPGGGCCKHMQSAFAVHWWSRTKHGEKVAPKNAPTAPPVAISDLLVEIAAHNKAAARHPHVSSAAAKLATSGFANLVPREVGGGLCTHELVEQLPSNASEETPPISL